MITAADGAPLPTPAVPPSSMPPSPIDLCVDSDLTLVVGEHRFRVSRNTLCMASPVWGAMLKGPFKEASQNEITLSDDDDPEALLTVLRIAHLKTYEVSRSLDLHQLVKMATICDKYDTVATCRPLIGGWVDSWIKSEQISGVFGFGNRFGRQTPTRNEEFLWVSWVFGYEQQFTELATSLQLMVSTNVDDALFAPRTTGLFSQNLPIRLPGIIPSGIAESLLEVRQATVKAQLNVFYTIFDRIKAGNTCKSRVTGFALFGSPQRKHLDSCNALALGSLIRAFERFGECYSGRPTSLTDSISTVHWALATVGQCAYFEPAGEDQKEHWRCDLTVDMKKELEEVYKAVKSPVLDSHILHLRKQWAKGRTEP
ncbi:hypothetical protein EG328_011923 [Venturia inaequalis]|uniref:BTB domain-containing protein n=1 Tax=Venturia inaequalis TaxID=5025 RepID=A0A8H3U492_VENIN|nr:hypothetical protein EG328_011923 [Venturia inaequalis]RDI78003.1 hypothetical protein Vi05172_g11937 [Venturia inaequalis]